MQSKYSSIAERILLMALESVDYCEDKAIQILNIVVADTIKEDEATAAAAAAATDEESGSGDKMTLDLKG